MSRPISDLLLPHFLKKALKDKEYYTVADLSSTSAADLALELSIGLAQAQDILRQADTFQPGPSCPAPGPVPGSQLHSSTAAELLHSVNRTRFSTLSGALDELIAHFALSRNSAGITPSDGNSPGLNLKGKARALGGGAIAPGMVLELSGPPGGGKTCVGLAVTLSARIGSGEGDEEEEQSPTETPEVLIIDTEGSITADRLRLAAETFCTATTATPDDILGGMHFMRVPTQVQMIALLHTLDEWLEHHPKVKLVLVDTLSYHFRQPTLEHGARKRIMELAKKVIGQAATVHGCAIIITNQLATKLLTAENRPANFETGDRAVLMPQLGDAWTTERTVRITLFRGGAGDELRYAHASTGAGPGGDEVPWASFDIDNVGLPCDVPPVPDDVAELS